MDLFKIFAISFRTNSRTSIESFQSPHLAAKGPHAAAAGVKRAGNNANVHSLSMIPGNDARPRLRTL